MPAEDDALALITGMPGICELETSVAWDGAEFVATCCLRHAEDSVRPLYASRGAYPDAALRRAIDHCATYWETRARSQGSNNAIGREAPQLRLLLDLP